MKNKIFIIVALFFSKNVLSQMALFTKVAPSKSNVYFTNIINEDKNSNNFLYEYLYNGGGVAVADINNDGLSDIYFSSSLGDNKLYLNKGNLVFEDITQKANVNGGDGFKTGVTFVDINNDGLMDIYVCKSAAADVNARRNLLYVNNGNLTFTERAKEYGIDDASYSTQAYFADFDKDGDVDLFLLNHPAAMNAANKIVLSQSKNGQLDVVKDTTRTYVSCRYYINTNKKFKDKTISAGLGTYAFGLSAVIADINKDGYLDIYTCNDYHEPDYLFINNKNGTFTNQYNSYFKHGTYSSMGSDYADINNDGEPDLITVDMVPETNKRQKELKGPGNYDQFEKRVKYNFGVQYTKNCLQLNNGNNTFSDISYLAGVAFTDWSWAPMIADFDNDGLKDIYITNGYLRDVTNLDYAMFNADAIRKDFFKTNNGNDAMKVLQQIPSVATKNYFFKNNGNLTFNDNTDASGLGYPSFSNGGAYADLDNDGDLEIICNNFYDSAFIFKNNIVESKINNYLRFKLQGNTNITVTNTIINIETEDGKKQTQHYYTTKGYLSSHEQYVHFGIGKNTSAKVVIMWPNGTQQIIEKMNANETHVIKIESNTTVTKPNLANNTLFKNITAATNINYTHKENDYIDFKLEPLLPHKFSMQGPCIAVADINNDGLDDFFVGGSYSNAGETFIQKTNGTFEKLKNPIFDADKNYEDGAATFFDADKDGDMDLIVITGGNEFPNELFKYPVRLYMNNGSGNFTKSNAIANINTSAKTIAIADYDKDGDQDIFIGGQVIPGKYGLKPESYLLQNDKGIFKNITPPALKNIGMVTDATFTDIDKDGFEELVLVGEWMPLSIFKNNNGQINTTALVNEKSYGWWHSLTAMDINKDGNIDFIGGNISLNTRFRANEALPLNMIAGDIDKNGSIDCIIGLYYNDGMQYPYPGRDALLDQMVSMKKKYLRYENYSSVTFDNLFTKEQLANTENYKANCITNTFFMGDGKGNFTLQMMPPKAQLAPINAAIPFDFDNDGIQDILIAGNDYSTEVETGRYDAGIGLAIKNLGNGKFKSLPATESGLNLDGDVKCMKPIKINGKSCFIIGRNAGKLEIWQWGN
jgi:enediyne biosynthesis protein E4